MESGTASMRAILIGGGYFGSDTNTLPNEPTR
jgi:hypothetical protein